MRVPVARWNALEKPAACDVRAEPCDVFCSVRSMWCLCQRSDNFNNIVAFRKRGAAPCTSNIRDMFGFLYYLKRYYHVEYVRIEGAPKKYRLLLRLFDTVVQVNEIDGRDVFYFHIDREAEKTLYKIFMRGSCHAGG